MSTAAERVFFALQGVLGEFLLHYLASHSHADPKDL